jgi:enoyl-CoA hydratase
MTGAGDKAFIAGADIEAMVEMDKNDASNFVHIGHDAMRTIEECTKPVIAMVNGYALGGGTETAMACDFVYASESAKFGLPEVSLGIFPGFGGTQRLPRYIGEQRAKELIFTGRMLTATDAYNWGIVNKVVPAEQLLEETIKLAHEIIKRGQVAVRLAKRAINQGMYQPLREGLEIERDTFIECFASSDRKEGMKAFIERREPEFKGK